MKTAVTIALAAAGYVAVMQEGPPLPEVDDVRSALLEIDHPPHLGDTLDCAVVHGLIMDGFFVELRGDGEGGWREGAAARRALLRLDLVDVTPCMIGSLDGLSLEDVGHVQGIGRLINAWQLRAGYTPAFYFDAGTHRMDAPTINRRVWVIDEWVKWWKYVSSLDAQVKSFRRRSDASAFGGS